MNFEVNYLCGTCKDGLERTDYRRTKWNEQYKDTVVKVIERCEKMGRLNPYQRLGQEDSEKELQKGLTNIDEMYLNDISSEEELDPDEMRSKRSEGDLQLNQDECTQDLKATFEDQLDQMDQHLP